MVSYSDKYFFINNIASIDVNEWNECAGLDHPFTRHEFLSALEESHSASTKTGWTPFHYVEYRREETQYFDGWMRHALEIKEGELKIKQKRVDLINCDAAHHNIQLFI